MKTINLKLEKKAIKILFFVLIFDFILFPLPSLATSLEDSLILDKNTEIIKELVIQPEEITHNTLETSQDRPKLPENKALRVVKSEYYTLTAYNSEVEQTNDQPCITANGFDLCHHNIEDSIAANFLKFGTKVKIPELFGDRVFVVRDRMNKRYHDRVDIWLKDKQDAINFGIKRAKIEILE